MSTDEISGGSNKSNYGKKVPLGLILEPSRDLAEQVAKDIETFSKYVNSPEINVQLLVGGDERKAQKKGLSGGVDIIVGTLGCIMGLFESKTLDMTQVRFFILDEADKLAEKENLSSVMKLYNAIPIQGVGDKRLQVCFFSATLHSPEITELASKICYNPTWVDLKGVDSVPDTVHHVIYRIDTIRDSTLLKTCRTKAITDGVHTNDNKDTADVNSQQLKEIKMQVLLGIIDKFKMSQCIIFCRTNVDCDNLETFLCNHGGGSKFREKKESGKENEYSCCVLAGMRDQSQRRINLEAFKDGNVRFLICTDVAARGIDIKNLPYVINMTLPDKSEDYIHRIGRVGRAECMGLAISIVASENLKEQVWYHKCNNRGKGCTNRKTADKGGCTIWQDEGQLLLAVEKRIRNKIPAMSPSYDLPTELAELGTEYGEKAGPEHNSNTYHVDELRPAVAELYDLEILSQNNFNVLKLNFGIL
jgi:ATP-dependent RNA helicase DDX1